MIDGKRRFETRHMAPEDRRDPRWTFMACQRLHRRYDAREVWIEALHDEAGANGPLIVQDGIHAGIARPKEQD